MNQDEILETHRRAYEQLHIGANTLLKRDTLYWTEKLLLRVVRFLYRQRLEQIAEVI